MTTLLTVPFSDLVAQYKRDYIEFYGRESRVSCHRLSHLVEAFGEKTILTPAEVDRFFNHFYKRAPSTRNRYRALLRHLLRWGADRGLVDGSLPPLKAEVEHNERTRRLSPLEEEKLLQVMPPDLRSLFFAALDTGLRRGALVKLKGRDVQDGTLVVPARIQKHRQSQRIPLTQRLQDFLKASIPGPNELLFPVVKFREKWDKARKEANCQDLHWHDLRGEFASRLDEKGVEVSVTSRLLGHASLSTTQRYLRPRTERFQEAIQKLGV